MSSFQRKLLKVKIRFHKYQGTGNDFILIDAFEHTGIVQQLNASQVKHLCDRHFGIGADGLIILEPNDDFDFEMIYYNSDGRLSSMCGNGGRCISRFARDRGLIGKECRFIAVDGPHYAELSENEVRLSMKDVEQMENIGDDIILNTGSPHYIRFVDRLDLHDFVKQAAAIRYSDSFAREGINVNFIQLHKDYIEMRTYERGVEDETLSCGTGVVAAALASTHRHKELASPIQVKTRGGHLNVSFEKSNAGFRNVVLAGPVAKSFEGEAVI